MWLLQPTIIPRDIDRRYADALTVHACARPMHAMRVRPTVYCVPTSTGHSQTATLVAVRPEFRQCDERYTLRVPPLLTWRY